MIKISHRGNLSGRRPEQENRLSYIDQAIVSGFDVEIDLREYEGMLYLGHDKPDHATDLEWLITRADHLWIHTKDFASLSILSGTSLRYFYHESDNHTIISNGLIWCHDINHCDNKCIIPLMSLQDIKSCKNINNVAGICSDYIKYI